MRWTDEQRYRLRRLKTRGMPAIEIARLLGTSEQSVSSQWERMTETDEQRERRLQWGRRRSAIEREQFKGARKGLPETHLVNPSVPSEVFSERLRLQAARDLQPMAGRIFGDPPPGFSALDRRGPAAPNGKSAFVTLKVEGVAI
jgi:hypothetical protein